jgi:hypothetical protein
LFLSGCTSGKRYRPVVKYAHPSTTALQKILRGTYGDRYRYAGQGPHRFDCSGLVYYSYATMNLWLPRTARDQSRRGVKISVSQLRYGDLIFFDTHRPYRGRVNHVGIYIGGGRFLHASSSKRRVISTTLRNPFYRKRILVCRRLIPSHRSVVRAPERKQRHRSETAIRHQERSTAVASIEPQSVDSTRPTNTTDENNLTEAVLF